MEESMSKQQTTRRQKDISRLMREVRKLNKDKIKAAKKIKLK